MGKWVLQAHRAASVTSDSPPEPNAATFSHFWKAPDRHACRRSVWQVKCMFVWICVRHVKPAARRGRSCINEKRHFRTLGGEIIIKKPKNLCVISQLQTDYLQLMETVITNNATDSSQTGASGEGCWDLWGYGVALCLSLACAISESKCSSFIYYSICFTPLFLFLFSHTPFSLSPLGGAVFIFGLLTFFFFSLRSWRWSPSITAPSL